jgi:hypothetical protein
MIRRLFWLLLGAVLGVTGYRKATALARSLRPAPRPSALADFAADVREGMSLYMERQSGAAASTLEGHRRRALPPGTPGGPSRRRSATVAANRPPATTNRRSTAHEPPAHPHEPPARHPEPPAHDHDEPKDGR